MDNNRMKINIIIFFFCASLLLLVNCEILTGSGDSPPPKNELSVKDSTAVRAILDANGLYNTNVREVIVLQRSLIGTINFKDFSINRFIISNAFDSMGPEISINIFNCPIDTIIIVDTIHINLAIGMNQTKLKSIPDNVSLLKGSLFLYFSNNEIEYIPVQIMNCKISYIDVQYNSLCSISDTMNNWIIKNSRNPDWKATQKCN
jgi:hypothetical protein